MLYSYKKKNFLDIIISIIILTPILYWKISTEILLKKEGKHKKICITYSCFSESGCVVDVPLVACKKGNVVLLVYFE